MYISFDIQLWSVIGSSSSLEVQGPIEACAPRSSEMTVAPWKCLFSCNCKKLQFFVAKFVKKVFVAKMCKNDVFVAKICNCKIRCFLSRKFANARSALALRGYLAVAASTPTYSSLIVSIVIIVVSCCTCASDNGWSGILSRAQESGTWKKHHI